MSFSSDSVMTLAGMVMRSGAGWFQAIVKNEALPNPALDAPVGSTGRRGAPVLLPAIDETDGLDAGDAVAAFPLREQCAGAPGNAPCSVHNVVTVPTSSGSFAAHRVPPDHFLPASMAELRPQAPDLISLSCLYSGLLEPI